MKRKKHFVRQGNSYKKIPGKLLAVILAAVLAVSGPASSVEVHAEEIGEEERGTKDVRMLDSGFETALELTTEGSEVSLEDEQSAYFRFIPQAAGIYTFSTTEGYNVYGELYSEDGVCLLMGPGSGEVPFCYYLKGDLTYYLKVYEGNYGAVSFSLDVTKRQPEGLEVFHQLQNTVIYGETTTLEVLAVSEQGEITYQWYKGSADDSGKIEGATGNTYEIPEDNTEKEYYCNVDCGQESTMVSFLLDIDTGLNVSSGHYDEEGEPTTNIIVGYGEQKELETVVSGGAGNLSYQWYKGSGADENNLIEGATTSSYEVTGSADCAREYFCEVRDDFCTQGITFFVEVDTGLEVNSGNYDEEGELTTSVTVGYGEQKELQTVVSGGAGNLSYQWYKGPGADEEYLIEGATSSSYEVTGSADCAREYFCEVSDGFCTRGITFFVAVDTGLTVSSGIYDEEGDPVTYVSMDYEGQTELKVTVSGGAGNLSYQWYEISWEDEDRPIEGANTDSYVVSGLNEAEAWYGCRVTDGICEDSIIFHVNLDTGLRVNSGIYDEDGDPVTSFTVGYGEQAKLKVTASGGAGDLHYQWYKNFSEDTDSLIEGATQPEYTVLDVVEETAYYCEVTDGIMKRGEGFTIRVDTGLKAVSSTGVDLWGENESSSHRNVSIKYREASDLEVTASGGLGGRQLTYQWYKNDDTLLEGATTGSYHLEGKPECEGDYTCEVSDGVTTVCVWFKVTLDTGLTVSSNTGQDAAGENGSSNCRALSLKLGDTVSLEVIASGGIDGKGLTYQWYQTDDEGDQHIIEGQTGTRYELSGTIECSRVYSCEISDGVITKDVRFYIDLDTGLKAVSGTGTDTSSEAREKSGYRNVSVKHQEKVTLEVEASSQAGDVTYQWYRGCDNEGADEDDEIIEGAAGSCYELLGDSDCEGTYFCRVSDSINHEYVFFYLQVDTGLRVSSNTGTDHYENAGDSNMRDVIVQYGKKTPLEVVATGGVGELKYQWYRGLYTNESAKIEGAVTNCYEATGKVPDEVGEAILYTCEVTDGVASRCVRFYTTVDNGMKALSDVGTDKNGKPGSSAERKVTVKRGGTVVLKVNAEKGEDAQRVTYQWYKYHREGLAEINNATGDSYTLSASDVNQWPYMYSCFVEDGIMRKEVLFYITVEDVKEPVSLKNCNISVNKNSADYTGAQVRPGVTVKHGTKLLKEGTDYTVAYSNNINIGTAAIKITGKGNYKDTVTKTFSIAAKKGKTYTVKGYRYKITAADQVAFTGLKNAKMKNVKIPKTVKIGGKNFKVTTIANNALKNSKATSITIGENVKMIGNSAFEGCSKLTKITISSAVTKIGSSAFKNCKKLGTITVKSLKLKTVGKNALKGIKSNAKIKVPAKKLKTYKNLFKKKGQGKKVKITK